MKKNILIPLVMMTLTTGSIMGIVLNKKQLVSKSFSQQNEYHLSLSSTNGKVNDNAPSRDRKSTTGLTNNNNSVSIEYYRGIDASNKVITLLGNGYYRLTTPIYGISSISLSLSNLTNYQDDDLIIYYGAYLRCDEIGDSYMVKNSETTTTITISDIDNAQYMMIKNLSENNITIDNIDITYSCSSISNNLVALDEDDNVIDNALVATFDTDHYEISKYNSSSLSTAKKVYIPEYILNVDTLYPVTHINGNFTKNAEGLTDIYLPETLTTLDSGVFGTTSGYTKSITSITLPKNLSSASNIYYAPVGGLLSLRYESINCSSISGGFSSTSSLTSLYISHDMTYLPKFFSNKGNVPTGLTIYYDGSEEEWNSLVDASSYKSMYTDSSITSKMVFAE